MRRQDEGHDSEPSIEVWVTVLHSYCNLQQYFTKFLQPSWVPSSPLLSASLSVLLQHNSTRPTSQTCQGRLFSSQGANAGIGKETARVRIPSCYLLHTCTDVSLPRFSSQRTRKCTLPVVTRPGVMSLSANSRTALERKQYCCNLTWPI